MLLHHCELFLAYPSSSGADRYQQRNRLPLIDPRLRYAQIANKHLHSSRRELAVGTPDHTVNDSIETLWVEILQPKTIPILVGVAYRPPSQSDFYDIFGQTCHQINTNKHEIIILGDFNTDVKADSNLQRRLVEFQTTFDLDQVIVEPTRITPKSRTIIDLILVSDPAKISQSGVIEIGVSDHFLAYCTRKITKVLYHKHNNVKIRSLKLKELQQRDFGTKVKRCYLV